jgi:phosphatidylserine decarboxylase
LARGSNHSGLIVREGFPFILPPGILALAAFFAGFPGSAFVLLLLTLFVIWFFRNPERKTPEAPCLVISPADGKVIRIEETTSAERPGLPLRKISIFMNVFNVHVNRIPCSGEVSSIRYREGKFLSADLDKASELNERNTLLIRTEDGREIITVQIAGLIARRIVCWVREGEKVHKGERFGMIRFGSRLEVFLPQDSSVLVRVGDRVRAGETPIGGLK